MPWIASGVGEVYNAPRVYNGQWEKPFVDGSHVCGTPADFAGHSVLNEELPPVVYNDADLPMCCVPPFIGSGGAVASGTADVEVISGVCPDPDVSVGDSVHYSDTAGLSGSGTWSANAFGFGLPGSGFNIAPSIQVLLQYVGMGIWGVNWGQSGLYSGGFVEVSCTDHSLVVEVTIASPFGGPPVGTVCTFTW